MRLSLVVAAAFVLSLSTSAFAQEWIEYTSREDLFTVNFPDQPTVRDVTYPTEYGITLPGRVHSSENGPSRYSTTVIDYSNTQKIHAARLENCKKYPNLCNNPYIGELRGAMDHAAYNFMKRATKVLHYAYYNSDRIEGRRLQLANSDGTQTFAAIHMHENRLYILEGTVPANYPPPAHFQQSLGFIDRQGIRVRYDSIYSNMYPAPPRIQYQVPQAQGQPR
jgi:hypothetical protein